MCLIHTLINVIAINYIYIEFVETGASKLLVTKSLPASRASRVNKVNQASMASSPVTPVRRRPSQVSVSKINRGGQSPLVTAPSSSIRIKRCEAHHVSDSKPSLYSKPKTRDQSPLAKYVTDSNGSLKLKKTPLTMNPAMSPARVTRATDTHLKLQKRILSGSSTCSRRRCSHVPDLDKITRGSLSPLALSPLSPYVMRTGRRTCGHASDSEGSCSKNKRESMSPFAMSPLSPYVTRTTCGHVSD